MNVSYVRPLQLAWARMQRMLLRPAHLETWLVLGFAAFLSEGLPGGRGVGYSGHGKHGVFPAHWLHGIGGLLSGFLLTGIGMTIVAAMIVLAVVLIWVNSRGRFIFLDDVARERASIVEPWNRLGSLGNSAFLWWLGFLMVCAAVVVLLALPFLASLAAFWSGGRIDWSLLGALWVLLAAAAPFGIVVAFTVLFFSDFVVPIMYRHQLGAIAAWGRFLALFRAHPGSFLLYGLFVALLWIVVGAVLAVVGFMSCCVGFVLLALPYVSSIILLPLLVTFRALGPEFLAQFGPDERVFAVEAAPPVAVPAAGVAPTPAASAPPAAAPDQPPAPGSGSGT